jgi:hypothetical protein
MPACSAFECESSWMRALAAPARASRPRGVAQPLLEHLHREPRGYLARLRAAHPVGDDEQRRARQQRVLVGTSLTAGVGGGVLLGDAEHQAVLLAVAHASASGMASTVSVARSVAISRVMADGGIPSRPRM